MTCAFWVVENILSPQMYYAYPPHCTFTLMAQNRSIKPFVYDVLFYVQRPQNQAYVYNTCVTTAGDPNRCKIVLLQKGYPCSYFKGKNSDKRVVQTWVLVFWLDEKNGAKFNFSDHSPPIKNKDQNHYWMPPFLSYKTNYCK